MRPDPTLVDQAGRKARRDGGGIATALGLLIVLLAPSGAAVEARAADAAAERAVTVASFLGLPPDSISGRALMRAFHDELDSGWVALERRTGAEWAPSDTQRHVFRLVEAAPPGESWVLEVSIRLPPPMRVPNRRQPQPNPPPDRQRVSNVRSSRGLVVVVTARPPVTWGRPVESAPVTYRLYFAEARRVVAATPNLPGGGYAYPWQDAGRVVARAALGTLLAATRELPAERRVDLAPATRVEEEP